LFRNHDSKTKSPLEKMFATVQKQTGKRRKKKKKRNPGGHPSKGASTGGVNRGQVKPRGVTPRGVVVGEGKPPPAQFLAWGCWC